MSDVGPARWRRARSHPLTHLVAACVVVVLVQAFVVKVYAVPSGSMEPTLSPGDRIVADRLFGGEPSAGDVVVFERPDDWAATDGAGALVKRVVATAGQTISCCDDAGRLLVDGEPLDEPYVGVDLPFESGAVDCTTSEASLRCLGEYTVPAGRLVVLGDRRAGSVDSFALCRSAGAVAADCVRTVPVDDVVGTVRFRVWPLGSFGGV